MRCCVASEVLYLSKLSLLLICSPCRMLSSDWLIYLYCTHIKEFECRLLQVVKCDKTTTYRFPVESVWHNLRKVERTFYLLSCNNFCFPLLYGVLWKRENQALWCTWDNLSKMCYVSCFVYTCTVNWFPVQMYCYCKLFFTKCLVNIKLTECEFQLRW